MCVLRKNILWPFIKKKRVFWVIEFGRCWMQQRRPNAILYIYKREQQQGKVSMMERGGQRFRGREEESVWAGGWKRIDRHWPASTPTFFSFSLSLSLSSFCLYILSSGPSEPSPHSLLSSLFLSILFHICVMRHHHHRDTVFCLCADFFFNIFILIIRSEKLPHPLCYPIVKKKKNPLDANFRSACASSYIPTLSAPSLTRKKKRGTARRYILRKLCYCCLRVHRQQWKRKGNKNVCADQSPMNWINNNNEAFECDCICESSHVERVRVEGEKVETENDSWASINDAEKKERKKEKKPFF